MIYSHCDVIFSKCCTFCIKKNERILKMYKVHNIYCFLRLKIKQKITKLLPICGKKRQKASPTPTQNPCSPTVFTPAYPIPTLPPHQKKKKKKKKLSSAIPTKLLIFNRVVICTSLELCLHDLFSL